MVAVTTTTPNSASTNTLATLHTSEKHVASENECDAIQSFAEPLANSSWYLSDDSEDNDEIVVDDPQVPSLEACCGLNLSLLMQRRVPHRNDSNNNTTNNNRLQLTTLLSVPWALDIGMSRILPQVVLDHTEEFLRTPRHLYDAHSTTTERLLYVAQAEVAHATPDQCDVIVSDRATTCHIFALYSYRRPQRQQQQQQQQQQRAFQTVTTTAATTLFPTEASQHSIDQRRSRRRPSLHATPSVPLSCSSPRLPAPPLGSLTHLDETSYESCIRAMIQKHKRHHDQLSYHDIHHDDDKIIMDIHIVGGFEDSRGLSRSISNWLLLLLLQIASEEADAITIILQTCAMTCLNNETQHRKNPRNILYNEENVDDDDDDYDSCGYEAVCSPRGRGLALDLRTGHVKLAHVMDESIAGPMLPLRAARLWANSNHSTPFTPTLSVIHTTTTDTAHDEFTIEPFVFGPFDDLEWLLSLSDDLLLQQTSTSPDVEEDDYCILIRKSLQLLQNWNCLALFGPHCDRPLKFQREVVVTKEHGHQGKHQNVWTWIPPPRPHQQRVSQRRQS